MSYKSKKVLLILFGIVITILISSFASADVLDDFDDNSIDPLIWSPPTTGPNTACSETGQVMDCSGSGSGVGRSESFAKDSEETFVIQTYMSGVGSSGCVGLGTFYIGDMANCGRDGKSSSTDYYAGFDLRSDCTEELRFYIHTPGVNEVYQQIAWSISTPVYLKIEKTLTRITGYYSANGVSWTATTYWDFDNPTVQSPKFSEAACIGALNGGFDPAFHFKFDNFSYLLPTPPDTTPPTNSSWNVTSNNVIGDTEAWNTDEMVHITSDLLSLTVTTNKISNGSCILDQNLNHTATIDLNENYLFATLNTVSHAYTVYDDISEGIHCLYCSFIDELGNEYANSTSGCLQVNLTFPSELVVTSNKPDDLEEFLAYHPVTFNFSASDIKPIQSCDLKIEGIVNQTIYGVSNNSVVTNFNDVEFPTGVYEWNVVCTAFDETTTNQSALRTVNITGSGIEITLDSPANDSSYFLGANVLFNFSITDYDIAESCSLRINGTINQTIYNVDNNSVINNFAPITFPEGNYGWDVNCIAFDKTPHQSELRYFSYILLGVNVELCPGMSGLVYFLTNFSYYNWTTSSFYQYDMSPLNEDSCGYSYNITADIDGEVQAKLDAFSETLLVKYNNILLTTSWVTIINATAGVEYFINITGSYVNATSITEFEDEFQLI